MKGLSWGSITRILPKIWQQIFFILVFLVVVPLIILGCLLMQTSQHAIKTAVLNNHREIALHTTGEVKEHVEGARHALFVSASILGRLHADAWQQETAIVELSLRNPTLQKIAVVEQSGQEVAVSELGTGLQNRSHEAAFQQAIQGNAYLSSVKTSESYEPLITIAEPIKRMGRVKEVLIADLNLRSVWQIIDKIHVGDQGIAYVIDESGRIIAHPDKKKILMDDHVQDKEIIEGLRAGQAGNVETIKDNGQRWLTSYAPIEVLGWGLIITLPESEAYAALAHMKVQSWMLILLSVFATILISLLLARYMSQPMKRMLEGTQRITKGDYSVSFPIRGRSEIDQLLFAFNRMALKMKKTQEMEKLSIVGKASTAIAHELKNSLQLVETYVKLLPTRYKDEDFIKKFSATIPDELNSWKSSLKNIMDFAKFGQSSWSMEPLSINRLVEETAVLSKFRAEHLGLVFDVQMEEEHVFIKGNEEKLKQVLLNLVTNAFEATVAGGTILIKTRVSKQSRARENAYTEIEISNSGISIQQDRIDQLFKPFYTTKSYGLGLGLSICKEIIDRHEGQIKVVVDESANTTSFIMSFPICHTVHGRKNYAFRENSSY